MSTRSMIIITDDKHELTLYHHWDGYPEGVGSDLISRYRNRLDKLNVAYIANELVKAKNDNYEITYGRHTDIEYMYNIDLVNKRITCRPACFSCEIDDFEYGNEINLEPYYKANKADTNNEAILAEAEDTAVVRLKFNMEIGNGVYDQTLEVLRDYCLVQHYPLEITVNEENSITKFISVSIELQKSDVDSLLKYLDRWFV